ncbi:hypothetical protein [Amycolatopsis kentuckyensis]|uniref:hypothetical protein n=1 Tax=Amycolatopsis kentuckyensis TaxID=218823 RepID=UPI000A3B47B0|nr:hypothetical protein [Amycolatopsis kentuckyensis]
MDVAAAGGGGSGSATGTVVVTSTLALVLGIFRPPAPANPLGFPRRVPVGRGLVPVGLGVHDVVLAPAAVEAPRPISLVEAA